MKTEISIDPCKRLNQLLVLFLALTLSPSMLLAQQWDHLNRWDKANDPTGAWLIRSFRGDFILTVFHKGGTLTGDVQGESAFGTPPSNVISSPESGIWQKTGGKTFAATFLTIEYPEELPDGTFHQFDKVQFTGVLSASGDRMDLKALITFFDADGNRLDPGGRPKYHYQSARILPGAHILPIPPIPPPPQ